VPGDADTRKSGKSTNVWRVNRNRSVFIALTGVLNDASSYTNSFIRPPASSEKPAFFVHWPYADRVTGFVRSNVPRGPTARGTVGSTGAVRTRRNRISFFVPSPPVRFVAVERPGASIPNVPASMCAWLGEGAP